MLALTVLLASRTGLAAQTPAGAPAWVRRYFASEATGDHFAHAWKGTARRIIAERQQLSARDLVLTGTPGARLDLHGTYKVPVVAAAWSDRTPAYAPSAYQQLFFGSPPNGYSLNQFYREASGGRFGFAGTVTPWITLPQNRAYYMQGFPTNTRGRYGDYLYDALSRADAQIDWTRYDNDGPDGIPNSGDDDGYVDLVLVVHPGADGVCRGDSLAGPVATGFRLESLPRFGRKAYPTHSIGRNGKPIMIDDFVMTAGLACDGKSLATVNIVAHETGHALGLPDLYDRDFSSQGVGAWDVMSYGLYALPGRPSLFGAWTRWQLGWGTQVPATAGWNALPPAESGGVSVRIDVPNSREYFLVENRRQVGADLGLPNAGLVVWHVDPDSLAAHAADYTAADDDRHPGIAVVRANAASAAAEVFPGAGNVSAFGMLTTPAATLFGGAYAGFSLDSMGTTRAGQLGMLVSFGIPLGGVADVLMAGSDVVDDLLAPGTRLSSAQELALDALGNRNGVFDIGDVVAWMGRNASGSPALARTLVAVQNTRR